MRISGFSWFAPAAASAGDPLTLSSPAKATLFTIIVALLSHNRSWLSWWATKAWGIRRPKEWKQASSRRAVSTVQLSPPISERPRSVRSLRSVFNYFSALAACVPSLVCSDRVQGAHVGDALRSRACSSCRCACAPPSIPSRKWASPARSPAAPCCGDHGCPSRRWPGPRSWRRGRARPWPPSRIDEVAWGSPLLKPAVSARCGRACRPPAEPARRRRTASRR